MIEKGCPILQIYDELVEDGRLTMSYNNFLFYVRGRGKRMPGLKTLEKNKRAQRQDFWSQSRPAATVDGDKNKPFTHEKLADLEELVGSQAKR